MAAPCAAFARQCGPKPWPPLPPSSPGPRLGGHRSASCAHRRNTAVDRLPPRSPGWSEPRCRSSTCAVLASSGRRSMPWLCGSMASRPRRTPSPARLLCLPVLRRAAPRRSRGPAQPRPCPPGARVGKLILTRACPRTGSAWTTTGTPYEPRGLKHRPDGAIRIVPAPPVLAALLHAHLCNYATTPDGRLFRGSHGGILSESVYGRIWHTARTTASAVTWPPPHWPGGRTTCGTPLYHYGLRHLGACRGRRPRREQRPRPAHRLHPLPPRPGRHREPADRARPSPAGPVTVGDSKRFAEPLALPRSCPPYVRDQWISRTHDRILWWPALSARTCSRCRSDGTFSQVSTA
jgi:hypothetical protein